MILSRSGRKTPKRDRAANLPRIRARFENKTCVKVCPQLFEMDGDVAAAKMENVPRDLEKKAKEVATSCPVEAIVIE